MTIKLYYDVGQANKLVRELRPRALALPEQYAPPPPGAPPRPHIGADLPALLLRRGECRRVAARRTAVRASLSGDLAAAAEPRDVRGLRLAPLAAALTVRDARLELTLPPAPLGVGGGRLEAGAVDPAALVLALAREGLEARVEAGAGGASIVHLPRQDALLHLEPHATHVFCESDPVRQALRRALQHATPDL